MKRSQTSYVILGLLAIESKQSGYEIRKTVKGSVGYFWGESYGQIYPALKRLLAEGLIVASDSASAGGRKRQEYSLTTAGRAALDEWLAVPYREDPPRDEFLLKLFFGAETAPSVSIAHVRRFQQRYQSTLAMFQQVELLSKERNSDKPGFPFWMLTLKFGLAQIRSALEWSESALAMLTEVEKSAMHHESTEAKEANSDGHRA